jgi:hypothetical protein
MVTIKVSPTPFGTVHVTALIPASQIAKGRRSFASQVGRYGVGKRLSVIEHQTGQWVRIRAIYRKQV